ncbi:hypothetical protein ACVIW2_007453 [Bradyrhizobium huanghuaihaiense]
MRDRFVDSTAWSDRRAWENWRSRSHVAGMVLTGTPFLLSGMIVGLFLSGQFTSAGLAYVSLIVSGAFGFGLCGLSTPLRTHDPRR